MTFIVHAIKPAILPAIPKLEMSGEDSSHAQKGKREVFVPGLEKFYEVNVYEFGLLKPGNLIKGPAIIETPTTTMFILNDQIGKVDQFRNLKIIEGG
jgi:N-methylhydantoinase A